MRRLLRLNPFLEILYTSLRKSVSISRTLSVTVFLNSGTGCSRYQKTCDARSSNTFSLLYSIRKVRSVNTVKRTFGAVTIALALATGLKLGTGGRDMGFLYCDSFEKRVNESECNELL